MLSSFRGRILGSRRPGMLSSYCIMVVSVDRSVVGVSPSIENGTAKAVIMGFPATKPDRRSIQ